jgi:S-formylglutathione hydrolase FrmB
VLLVAVEALLPAVAADAIAGSGPPANTWLPRLAGTAIKGETLTLDAGGWGGEHLIFSYEWQRCDPQGSNCAAIRGAGTVTRLRSDEYTLGQADVGQRVRVLVTATNLAGTRSAASPATAVVADTGFASGSVEQYGVFSPALDRAQEVLVYLPPGYSRRRRYPVLYLLHGYPGDPSSLVAGVPAGAAEDALLARHAMRPLILVMPSGKPDPPADTAWVDGVGSASGWETFVARDVVHWTDSCFRTDPRGSARGIAGLSDGGYGALNIALHHPGEFHLVESWSGYTQADNTLVNVYGDDPARLSYNNPALYLNAAAVALKRAGVFFWLYIGNLDSGLPENQRFAAALTVAHVANRFTVFEGSHLPSFYRAHLSLALQLASSRLTRTPATQTRTSRPLPGSCRPTATR